MGELQTKSASVDTSISNIHTFSASTLTRLTNIETTSASVNISVSNLNTTTASLNTSVSNLNTTTASLNTSVAALNTYSSSLKSAFELTGSNVVVLGDFTVRGTTTSVESNTIQLGDNIIELNGTGAANGGLLVKDPTAPNTASGSLLWDSTNDYWKAGALGAESKIALMGGDNLVTASAQILFDQINGYSTYSGSVSASFAAVIANVGSGVGVSITNLNSFSSSTLGRLTNIESTSASVNNSVTALNTSTASQQISIDALNVTSASLNTFTGSAAGRLTNLESTSASVNNSVVALNTTSASQNTRLGLLETSTGSLNSFTSSIDTTIKTKLNLDTVVSSSAQVISLLPTGVVSGSSQILGGSGIVSGSSQVDITSTTNYTTFSSSVATAISASTAAATWTNLNGKPAGIVSGSSQVVLNDADKTGFSTDDVTEGSNLYYTDVRVKTKLNVETVVSGSSQIDITSTTGFNTFSGSIATSFSIIDGGTY